MHNAKNDIDMRKTAILILMMLLSVMTYAQYDEGFTEVNEFGEKTSETDKDETDFLGFRLLEGNNNDLVRFYEIHVTFEKKLKFTQLTMDGFVYRAMGKIKCAANPYGKNLFECYGIKDPNVVCRLWKLRYSEHPYKPGAKSDSIGWASGPTVPSERQLKIMKNPPKPIHVLPSEEQFQILHRYGINTIQDLCYGDMCFMLMKDMCDPNWVSKYRNRGAGGAIPISEDGSVKDEEEYIEDK